MTYEAKVLLAISCATFIASAAFAFGAGYIENSAFKVWLGTSSSVLGSLALVSSICAIREILFNDKSK